LIGKIFLILCFLGAGWIGFWMAQHPPQKHALNIHPEKEFPLSERKSFAFIVYAHNQASWCERALRSIFEQEYDYYRVIFIDDASVDNTFEKAKAFILESHQEQKVILMRNEEKLGPALCLFRAVDNLLDKEIAIPLNAKNWLTHSGALTRLNGVYQNPDVWVALAASAAYPSYEIRAGGLETFYAAVFKQLRLDDLYHQGAFSSDYLHEVCDLSGGRLRHLKEPLLFSNESIPSREPKTSVSPVSYPPLSAFPTPPTQKEKADIVLFSFDRPLQLYSCLESIHRYITGFETLSVIYRVSDDRFAQGYEAVKQSFPQVHYIRQSEDPKRDFKPLVLKTVFDSPSKYILFGVDDIIVKDNVDVNLCMDMMEKTGAYGFYLRFGKHIRFCYQTGQPQAVPKSIPLAQNIFAWDLKTGEMDWGFPNSVDMTLFRKSDLREAFEKMKFKTPNSLEFIWASEYAPRKALGLYFEHSKIVNIPLNIVGRTGNPHMNFSSPEELLAKFNEGLKIDIGPLHRIENPSPHSAIIPEFIVR
jgi:hypothetical protein